MITVKRNNVEHYDLSQETWPISMERYQELKTKVPFLELVAFCMTKAALDVAEQQKGDLERKVESLRRIHESYR